MKEFFDAYGIRVRLSSLLILLGPVIFWIILFVDETRTLPGMVVISAIVLASSAVLVIPMRIKSNEVRNTIFSELPTVTLLSHKNHLIDETTRQRYCKKIQERTTIDLSEPNKKENFKSAIEWLKANYQSSYRNHLVDEENINFGLLCNLLGVKKIWNIHKHHSDHFNYRSLFLYILRRTYRTYSCFMCCSSILFYLGMYCNQEKHKIFG